MTDVNPRLNSDQNLIVGFLESVSRSPEDPALVVSERSISYSELDAGARRIGATVQSLSVNPFCGVLGVGTVAVFEGILGSLMAGRAYVPLNPAFPLERTIYMLDAAEIDLLIVDEVGEALLPQLLSDCSAEFSIILPHAPEKVVEQLRRDYQRHAFYGLKDLKSETRFCPVIVEAGSPAYIMFTSGSTGKPKGVVVSHGNVGSFIASVLAMYDLSQSDRFSQMFDLTFDLSVFDMFVCWNVGASLWVVPTKSRMAPASFVRKAGLTVWFSVPAVGAFMKQLKMLRPNNFPSLRYSLFCGEPLPDSVAMAWQEAAPNSQLENLYGPTELTIACASHRWDPGKSPSRCVNGIVPIGRTYDGLDFAVVDQNLNKVAFGSEGELCVRGPQTTLGYWKADETTSEKFVPLPWVNDGENRWYRTGDLVREISDGEMVFVGRVDNQVKVLGYRVELGEIEAHLRRLGQTDFAIAIPHPLNAVGAATGIVACLAGSKIDDETILDGCRRNLPDYMVPHWILRLGEMPFNANGKIDRNVIRSLIEVERGKG